MEKGFKCTFNDVNAADQPPRRHSELDSESIHLIKNQAATLNKTLSIGQSINDIQSLKIDPDLHQDDVLEDAVTQKHPLFFQGDGRIT